MHRLKLYALFISVKDETALYRVFCSLEMAFKAGLTVLVKSDLSILLPVSCFIIIFIYTSREKLEDSDFAKCTTVFVP